MKSTFLSIITITKNNRSGLQHTAHSITTQTSNDYEWIIIDGASTDGTTDDLINYKTHHNAQYRSEPDKGIYDAMNKGLAQATGEYVLFLNAGDSLATNNTIQELAKEGAETTDLIYGNGIEAINAIETVKKARHWSHAFKGMFTYHQAILYKRFLAQTLAYNTHYKISADYEFTVRFLSLCRHIQYIDAPICHFETGGLSQKNAHKARLEEFLIRENLSYGTRLQNILTFLRQTIAWEIKSRFPALYKKLLKYKS